VDARGSARRAPTLPEHGVIAGSTDPLKRAVVVASHRSRRSVGATALGLGLAAAGAIARPAEARLVEGPVARAALRADAPGPRRPTSGAYRVSVAGEDARPAYWAFVPPASREPSTVVLAMHGLGQRGETIGEPLTSASSSHNWVIVAPTIDYGDWIDPARLAVTEPRVMSQALDAVDHARRTLGVVTDTPLLAIGFSRGAQTVARLGILEPARFLAVAAASGGAYTLPTGTAPDTAGRLVAAPFPFGVGNALEAIGRFVDPAAIASVRFWVGVGAIDTSVADLPRQWDRFLGRNRVERATRFANALRRVGAVVQLSIIPGVGHELTPATITSAANFLRAAELAAVDQPPRLLAQAPLPSMTAHATANAAEGPASRPDAPWWQALVQFLRS